MIARQTSLAGIAASAGAISPSRVSSATLTTVNVSSSLEDDAAALLYGIHGRDSKSPTVVS